jgi:hypothetical protein
MDLFKKIKSAKDKIDLKSLELQNEAKSKIAFIDVFGEIVGIGHNPTLSREEKFKKMRESLDKLNDEDFSDNIANILKIIQAKKENCEQFKSVQEQVNSIYELVPRLRTQDIAVTKIITERRNGFELPL